MDGSLTGRPAPLSRMVFGTRRSPLALWQTRLVAESLAAHFPGLHCSIEEFVTEGDAQPDRPLPEIGGKGLFTATLDQAVRDGAIDIAVHSLKDLPVDDGRDLLVIPVLRRDDPRDVLVSRDRQPFEALPPGARVGSSSWRRQSQLLALRPDLRVCPVRGNVNTRIARVQEGELDAVVLAAAGVHRLGRENEVATWFDAESILPAPGQGALAVTCLRDRPEIAHMLEDLVDAPARACVTAERRFLQALGGGCSAPIAALARPAEGREGELELIGRVCRTDGSRMITERRTGADPYLLGDEVAEAVLHGGREILAAFAGNGS